MSNRRIIIALLVLAVTLPAPPAGRLAGAQALDNRRAKAWQSFNRGLQLKDRPEESAKRKAITNFEQSLAIYEELGDDSSAATTLINIGWLYDHLNLKADAVRSYLRAHSLYKKSNDQLGMASALNSAGWAYRALGDKQSALANYFVALEIYRRRPDRQGEAVTLRSIGAAYLDLGRNSEALSYLLQARKIEIEIDTEFTRFSRAATLDDLGTAYKNLGQNDEALKHYAEALSIFRRNRIPGAGTLYKMGLVYLALGNKDAALGQFMESLFAAYSTSDRETETNILSSLMSLWAALGNPRLAVFYGKQSVNLSQSLRANIKTLSPDLQRAYLRSIENTYRALADLLAAEGRIPEAQQVLAMLKEEEYSQFVQRASPADSTDPVPQTAREENWQKRYREIAGRIISLGRELGELRAKQPLSAEEEARWREIEADLTVGQRHFNEFLKQLYAESGGGAAGREKVSRLKEYETLKPVLAELGEGAVALYTIVGEDKYRVILITSETEVTREYPIKREELNRLVLQFREVFDKPPTLVLEKDPLPLAQRLYDILIGPVAADLKQAGARTLMWSLDGTLRYVPISALHDGEEYVVENYRNVVFTLGSLVNMREPRVAAANRRGLGFGVTRKWEPFPALPATGDELRGIIRKENAAEGGRGVLPGETLLDDDFTAAQFMSQLRRRRFPIVHISSHFLFKPNKAESFLLLGDGHRLTLDEVGNTSNLFSGVELLTLSACQTALGSGVEGEEDGMELEGFGVLAQQKGAKAIIATLWPVADSSTSELMQEFYRTREGDARMSKAEALRLAQEKLLKKEKGELYSHPFFWAPFILIGNWK